MKPVLVQEKTKYYTSSEPPVGVKWERGLLLNINMRKIHLVEVKYCEDARSGHQL